ncbi:MAG: glycogen/starch synthase [Prevotellaceae bacterium]|nr:glycogen/starch synthase [Prevotellaceae bacterium]
MAEHKKILFVNSEMVPYLPESRMANICRHLPQAIQEMGREIRSFMPRYGCINERRNQLHEVIRLSGMNMIIKEIDRPLIIKVASITPARMQVYFIDNEDYFHRKSIYKDLDNNFFDDNDERAIFFVRGVLETVKKLRWKPDLIHCHGWLSHLLPLYLKKGYHDDPLFTNAKVVLSLYNDIENEKFDINMRTKALIPGIKNKDLELLAMPNTVQLAKLALQYSNGVILGDPTIHPEITDHIETLAIPVLPYIDPTNPETYYINTYNQFYDQILDRK